MRALIAALLLCLSCSAFAADIVTVRAKSGSTARVASSHASNFQCLIDSLEAEGYRIQFMGGYRSGTCAPPRYKHPCGLALDINQTDRNVVTRRLPSNANQLARTCGLFHGAIWQYADGGHFEVPNRQRFADSAE